MRPRHDLSRSADPAPVRCHRLYRHRVLRSAVSRRDPSPVARSHDDDARTRCRPTRPAADALGVAGVVRCRGRHGPRALHGAVGNTLDIALRHLAGGEDPCRDQRARALRHRALADAQRAHDGAGGSLHPCQRLYSSVADRGAGQGHVLFELVKQKRPFPIGTDQEALNKLAQFRMP
ncbi:hypothetical protein COLO4_01229 [Corchorus olitorius]|uniref:Uncharacterized protein n=1 Tax=Corchorus olitorius TaxID=93759 RepID=A0A1R3L2Y6_9ROSI|nr:hypothetical protein COLO4_01229 [Corchorus olitorius]